MTAKEKAQKGLVLILDSMVELLNNYPEGLSHADIAKKLDLEMGYHGGKNYASQTILHQLVYRGKILKIGEGRSAVLRLPK